MLRRTTACFNVVSLVLLSLVPLSQPAAAQGKSRRMANVESTTEADTPAAIETSKISPDLLGSLSTSSPDGPTTNAPGGGASKPVRVVIQTQGRSTSAQDAAIAAADGVKVQGYEALDAVVADVPLSALAGLASRTDVEYISADRKVKATMGLTREAVGSSQLSAGGEEP
ncbi:MAG: hypothetical protein LC800_17105, partial [Acidobacteria bacterium]|nr:hypothetical protein [Acidobacteriota bacterium]